MLFNFWGLYCYGFHPILNSFNLCHCCFIVQLCLTLCNLHGLQHDRLPSTISRKLLIFMSIEAVMLFQNPVLCCPLFFLPSVFPSIRFFSNESVLCIRWPEYWSFSFSISPCNEYSVLISFGIDWFNLLSI